MSNDEEKEEEEVRREHTHLEEEQRFVSLSVRSIFLRIIRAFRCTRRAILDFFSARDRRALERGGGAAVARNFAETAPPLANIVVVALVVDANIFVVVE